MARLAVTVGLGGSRGGGASAFSPAPQAHQVPHRRPGEPETPAQTPVEGGSRIPIR